MNIDRPQILKNRKVECRKEWGRYDLGEREVKSRECERVCSKLRKADGNPQREAPRYIREL